MKTIREMLETAIRGNISGTAKVSETRYVRFFESRGLIYIQVFHGKPFEEDTLISSWAIAENPHWVSQALFNAAYNAVFAN